MKTSYTFLIKNENRTIEARRDLLETSQKAPSLESGDEWLNS